MVIHYEPTLNVSSALVCYLLTLHIIYISGFLSSRPLAAPDFTLATGRTAIVIDACRSSVVIKAIVVEVNLVDTLLQHFDHSVEGTQTVGIIWAAGMRVRDGNNGVVATHVSMLWPWQEAMGLTR